MNSPEDLAQNTEKSADSGPAPGYTSTRNSPQQITEREDTCYPLQHTGKSLKLDSTHGKDFILLVIVSFFNELLELN